MASGCKRSVLPLIRLAFQSGSVAGMTDGQLLQRFASLGDEVAFEALVIRHGRLILSVCRGLLHDPNDVEDAFQATLVILVRKAGSIRLHDSLGPWLYGVAYRVAVRARATAKQRNARERQATEIESPAPEVDLDRHELAPILHEELARLPERFRVPIVLCHLQGLSHDLAAQQLRWPVGTVRSRLSRARGLLRERLARRGLAVSATALSVELSTSSASASIPRGLTAVFLNAATQVAAGRSVGMLSGPVAALTEGVLRSMLANSFKSTAFALVASGFLATGVAVHSLKARAQGPSVAAAGVSQLPRAEAEGDRPISKSKDLLDELNQPISLDLKQAPLSEALAAISTYTGKKFAFDTGSLRGVGVKSSTPVDLKVSNVSLKAAMNALLGPLKLGYRVQDDTLVITPESTTGGNNPLKLGYRAEDDTLVITPDSTTKHNHLVKTYYVGDLVLREGTRLEPEERELVDLGPMIQLLTSSVAPGQWLVIPKEATGGSLTGIIVPNGPGVKVIGTITTEPKVLGLKIAHSKEVHEQVSGLLKTLRQFQDHVQPRREPVQELERIPGSTHRKPYPIPKNKGEGPPKPAPAIHDSERLEHLFKELVNEVESSTNGRVLFRLERAPQK